MLEMLVAVAPLMVLILVGFAAGFAARFRSAAVALNGFVFYFALPTFIFTTMVSSPPQSNYPWAMPVIVLTVTPLASIALYVLCRVVPGRSREVAAPTSLAGTFGNVGYFGIPLSVAVLGPEAGLAAGLIHMLHNIVYMNGYPLVRTVVNTAGARDDEGGLKNLMRHQVWPVVRRGVLLNPMFTSIVLALCVVIWEWEVPELITEPVSMLGATAVPVALFCVGLALHPALEGIRSGGVATTPILAGTVSKLVVLPVLTWLAVLPFADQLGSVWSGALIILAATPSSTTVFLFSEEYDGDGRLAAAILVSSTALSLITLPLVAGFLL